VVRVGVGKHERRGNGDEETDGTGITWPPGWDAPPPALHPDHPSAPLPQVSQQGSVTPLWTYIHGPDHANPEGMPPVSRAKTAEPANFVRRDYQPRPGHDVSHQPTRGHGARRSHRPSHEYQPRAGRASGPRHAAGRPSRRLYAVPDEVPDSGTPFDEQYAVGLSDPAWPPGGLASAGDERPGQRLRGPGFAREGAATAAHEAWEEAAALRRAAEQEAAAILQHAAEEALAIRRAAEQEAADLRSAATTMSAELGQVAAYVTEYVGKHALAEQRPRPRPAAAPVIQEAFVRPAKPWPDRPVKPRPRPRSAPATKPATRQGAAMRKMVVAFATLIPVTLVSRHRHYGQHRPSRKPGPWIA
jgi:hypothetical protein